MTNNSLVGLINHNTDSTDMTNKVVSDINNSGSNYFVRKKM